MLCGSLTGMGERGLVAQAMAPAMPARDRSIKQMGVEVLVQRARGAPGWNSSFRCCSGKRLATTIDHGRCGHLVVWIHRLGQ